MKQSNTMNIGEMIEILPQEDQQLVFQLIKKLVLAWDPDFTKVTKEEAKKLLAAEESGFVSEKDVDWDNVGLQD